MNLAAIDEAVNPSTVALLVDLLKTFIPTAGIVAVALIQFRRHSSKVDEVKKSVGVPNGQGSVVEMLEAVLAWTRVADRRIGRIERRLDAEDRSKEGDP